MRMLVATVVLTMAVLLGGCGYTPAERGISGGLLGAGAGAGISALAGGNPGTGALIGGGLGLMGGALTAPQQQGYQGGYGGGRGHRRHSHY